MKYYKSKISSQKGLSFVEVMLTIVILSVGLIAIFRTFFVSLDRISHITNRLYVTTLLDNRMLEISRKLKIYKALPMDPNIPDEVNVGRTVLKVDQQLDIKEIDGFENMFELNISLTWSEGERSVRLSRSAYISNL